MRVYCLISEIRCNFVSLLHALKDLRDFLIYMICGILTMEIRSRSFSWNRIWYTI